MNCLNVVRRTVLPMIVCAACFSLLPITTTGQVISSSDASPLSVFLSAGPGFEFLGPNLMIGGGIEWRGWTLDSRYSTSWG